jgi:hypothetical protein
LNVVGLQISLVSLRWVQVFVFPESQLKLQSSNEPCLPPLLPFFIYVKEYPSKERLKRSWTDHFVHYSFHPQKDSSWNYFKLFTHTITTVFWKTRRKTSFKTLLSSTNQNYLILLFLKETTYHGRDISCLFLFTLFYKSFFSGPVA